MKKTIAIILSITLAFCFSGCNKKTTTSDVNSTTITSKNGNNYSSDTSKEIEKNDVSSEKLDKKTSENQPSTIKNSENKDKSITSQSADKKTSKPNSAHIHSYTKVVTPPTCTEKGYTTYTCSCGDSYISDYTNPCHDFNSMHICKKCGAVDKEHVYDFLIELTKYRGKAIGNIINFDIYDNGTTYLSYTPSDNHLIIYINGENSGHSYYSSITLDTFFYGTKIDNSIDITGFLDSKNYTNNSPLSDVHYNGQQNNKLIYIELSRNYTNMLLDTLNTILKNYHGTVADLGFKAF